jgi:hypothetical protein
MFSEVMIPPAQVAVAREYCFCAKSTGARTWEVPSSRPSSVQLEAQIDIATRVLMDSTSSGVISLEEIADFEKALRLPPAKIKARMLPRS